MSAAPRAPDFPDAARRFTPDEFLRWNEGRDGRRELVEGRIVMMTGGTQRHAELCLTLAVLLRPAALSAGFGIATDWAVRTFAGVRYPDVVVFPRDPSGRTLETDRPVLTAEILSPSTLAIDFHEKAREYTAFASLRHYVVLAQDEPRAWVWTRNDTGQFATPTMIVGEAESLLLPGLDVALPLADIYRGVA